MIIAYGDIARHQDTPTRAHLKDFLAETGAQGKKARREEADIKRKAKEDLRIRKKTARKVLRSIGQFKSSTTDEDETDEDEDLRALKQRAQRFRAAEGLRKHHHQVDPSDPQSTSRLSQLYSEAQDLPRSTLTLPPQNLFR